MSYRLILGLSLFGLAMGVATAFVIPPPIELYAWLAIFAVSGFAIAKRAPGRYVLHGLFVSVLDAVWVTAAHVALFDKYVVIHRSIVAVATQHGSAPVMMAAGGAIAGVVGGLALGIFAWVSSKFVVSAHSEFAGW
jgi:hypothetical protein